MESVDRSKVRHPSPPPGYIRPNPHIGLRPDLAEIDGQIFKFLALTIESGILEDSNPSSDFSVPNSDDDVQYVPVSPKVPPVIDLDVECLNLSDGEIPSTPEIPPVIEAKTSEKQPVEKEMVEAKQHLKSVKKDITRSSTKVKKYHSKKEKVVDYSSDSSTTESSHSKKKKKAKRKHRSRSSSNSEHGDSDNKDHKYIPSDVKQEENLFGSFHCKVCKLTMNAEGSFESHLNGKRHLKAVKAQRQNIAQSVESSLTVNTSNVKTTRYPLAPTNVIRQQVHDTALIQEVVEKKVKAPCPGLQKVIEIQGLVEVHYYCELCDSPCSSNSIVPHLQGRKHQLNCLKLFDERAYDRINSITNRKEMDSMLLKHLRNIEVSHGLGKMTVEREVKCKDHRDSYSSRSERAPRREDIPGPSHRYDGPEERLPESFQSTMIPDTSKSDFYCKICDSHMNNINMWEAHIRGKRHLKNVKKAPGEGPSKAKSIPLPNARAYIMDELEHVHEPVVGLQFMRETRNPELGGALYNCFPCGACLTSLDVIDHILTQKHRTKFLEKIEHPYWLTMNQMDIQGRRLGSIIEEACYNVQKESGPGVMEVHVMKSAVGSAVGSGRWC